MNNLPTRLASILLVVSMLVACGAPVRTQQTSLAPKTELLLIADVLVGAQVSLNDKRLTVSKNNLESYKYGIAGAADKSIEKQEVIRLPVDPGTVKVKISLNGKMLFEKKLYLVEGQTRELRL